MVDELAVLSNDPALLFLRGYPVHPNQVIDLTTEDSNNDNGCLDKITIVTRRADYFKSSIFQILFCVN
jgi:hypothetical protein